MKLKKITITFIVLLIAIQIKGQKITWNKKADLPVPISKAKAATVNGKIYVMGGVSPAYKGFSKANYEYDPALDTWAKKEDMPTGRTNFAIAAVDNKIYVIGGDPFLDKVEVYDPKTNTWDSLSAMPSKRQHINCAAHNNMIYLIGGFENICCPPFPQRCNWEECAKISNKNQVYNVLSDSWKELAPLPSPRHGLDMMTIGGKIYVIGGMGSTSSIWDPLNTNEMYDPNNGSWVRKKEMPNPRDGYGYSVQGDVVYLFGGWIAESQQTTNTIVYNTKTNSWSKSTNLPVKTGAFAYATINNKIYIFGGDKENYSEIFQFTYVGEIN